MWLLPVCLSRWSRRQLRAQRRLLMCASFTVFAQLLLLFFWWQTWFPEAGAFRLHLTTQVLLLLGSAAAMHLPCVARAGGVEAEQEDADEEALQEAKRRGGAAAGGGMWRGWIWPLFISVPAVAALLGLADESYAPAPAELGAGETFKVVSWNIQRGYRTGQGGWGLNLNDVASHVGKLEMDIVGLQEAEALFPLVAQSDITHILAQENQYHQFYGINPLLSSFDGSSFISKYPLTECQGFALYRYGTFPTFGAVECSAVLAPGESLR